MIINDVNVNYVDYGAKDGIPIVLLHGWGQNIQMMQGLGNNFQNTNRIIIIDLPGFGKSEEPKYAWSLDEYVSFLEQFLKKINVSNPIIIGHSFGGKLGLLYASKNKVSKLICLASPYKKSIKKESIKTKMLKTAKKIPVLNKLEGFAKKHIGSVDYRSSSEMMRQIMVNHVNYDITDKVKKIKCPTLLIWGTQDEAVDISTAYELEKLIDNCGLVTYEGCSHYAYLERFDQTIRVLKSFIGDE
jgi:pimeloyl-ACP methyl ester carboxylesterase